MCRGCAEEGGGIWEDMYDGKEGFGAAEMGEEGVKERKGKERVGEGVVVVSGGKMGVMGIGKGRV